MSWFKLGNTTAQALGTTALILCVFVGPAQAAEITHGGGIRVSGYGTLGVVHADAPDGWGFRREVAQPSNDGGTRADIDSRFGLQLNYAPNSQLEFVGQLLATRRSPFGRDSDSVEWAFAAYRPRADVVMRVGRVNVDAFFMSDYRNVGFAYPYARPPVEFYGVLPTVLDGADIAHTWRVADVRWRAKLFAGQFSSGDLTHDARVKVKPVLGAMISRSANGLEFRAGLTRLKLVTSPRILQPLVDGLKDLSALPVAEVANQADVMRSQFNYVGEHITYAALGVNYEKPIWQWTAEVTRVTGPPVSNFAAGYVSVGRRFGPVTVFSSVSRIKTFEPFVNTPNWGATLQPVLGPAIAQQAQGLATAAAFALNNSFGVDQRAITLGARWDVHPRVALKLQWDHVRVGANGGLLWANSNLDAGRANITSAVLDFVF